MSQNNYFPYNQYISDFFTSYKSQLIRWCTSLIIVPTYVGCAYLLLLGLWLSASAHLSPVFTWWEQIQPLPLLWESLGNWSGHPFSALTAEQSGVLALIFLLCVLLFILFITLLIPLILGSFARQYWIGGVRELFGLFSISVLIYIMLESWVNETHNFVLDNVMLIAFVVTFVFGFFEYVLSNRYRSAAILSVVLCVGVFLFLSLLFQEIVVSILHGRVIALAFPGVLAVVIVAESLLLNTNGYSYLQRAGYQNRSAIIAIIAALLWLLIAYHVTFYARLRSLYFFSPEFVLAFVSLFAMWGASHPPTLRSNHRAQFRQFFKWFRHERIRQAVSPTMATSNPLNRFAAWMRTILVTKNQWFLWLTLTLFAAVIIRFILAKPDITQFNQLFLMAVLGIIAFLVLFIFLRVIQQRQRYLVLPLEISDKQITGIAEAIKREFVEQVQHIGLLLNLRQVENVRADTNLSFFATSNDQDQEFLQELQSLSTLVVDSNAKEGSHWWSYLFNLLVKTLAVVRVSGWIELRPEGGLRVRIDFARRGYETTSVDIFDASWSLNTPPDETAIRHLAHQLALKLVLKLGHGTHVASSQESMDHFLAGLEASLQRNWWRAADEYRSAIHQEEATRGAFGLGYYHLGVAMLFQGELDEGIQHLQRAETSGPPLAETQYMLALATLYQNWSYLHERHVEFKAVERRCKMALQLRPHFAEVYHLLGTAYYQRAKLLERSVTQQYEHNDPFEYTIAQSFLFNYAYEYKQSEKYFRLALHAYTRALNRLAVRLDLYNEGQIEFERLVRERLTVMHRLADALRSRRFFAEADTYYEDVLAALPTNVRTLVDMAKSYNMSGAWQRSQEFIQRIMRRVFEAQWHPDANFYIGWMLAGGVYDRRARKYVYALVSPFTRSRILGLKAWAFGYLLIWLVSLALVVFVSVDTWLALAPLTLVAAPLVATLGFSVYARDRSVYFKAVARIINATLLLVLFIYAYVAYLSRGFDNLERLLTSLVKDGLNFKAHVEDSKEKLVPFVESFTTEIESQGLIDFFWDVLALFIFAGLIYFLAYALFKFLNWLKRLWLSWTATWLPDRLSIEEQDALQQPPASAPLDIPETQPDFYSDTDQQEKELLGRSVSHLDYALHQRPQYMTRWTQNNWLYHFHRAFSTFGKRQTIQADRVETLYTTPLNNRNISYLKHLRLWVAWRMLGRQYYEETDELVGLLPQELLNDLKQSSKAAHNQEAAADLSALYPYSKYRTVFLELLRMRKEYTDLIKELDKTGRQHGMYQTFTKLKLALDMYAIWKTAYDNLPDRQQDLPPVKDGAKEAGGMPFSERWAVDVFAETALFTMKLLSEVLMYEVGFEVSTKSAKTLVEWQDRWDKTYPDLLFLFTPRVFRFQNASLHAYVAYCVVLHASDIGTKARIALIEDPAESDLETLSLEVVERDYLRVAFGLIVRHPLAMFVQAKIYQRKGQHERAIIELQRLLDVVAPFDPGTQIANLQVTFRKTDYQTNYLDPDFKMPDAQKKEEKTSYRDQMQAQQIVAGEFQFSTIINATTIHAMIAQLFIELTKLQLSTKHLMQAISLSEYHDIDADNLILLTSQFDVLNRFADAQAVIKTLGLQRFLIETLTFSALKHHEAKMLEIMTLTRRGEYSTALSKGFLLYDELQAIREHWKTPELLSTFYINRLRRPPQLKDVVTDDDIKVLEGAVENVIHTLNLMMLNEEPVKDHLALNNKKDESEYPLLFIAMAYFNSDLLSEMIKACVNEYVRRYDDFTPINVIIGRLIEPLCREAVRMIELESLLYNNLAYNHVELRFALEVGPSPQPPLKQWPFRLIIKAIEKMKWLHNSAIEARQKQDYARHLAYFHDTRGWFYFRLFLRNSRQSGSATTAVYVLLDEADATSATGGTTASKTILPPHSQQALNNLQAAQREFKKALEYYPTGSAVIYYHIARVELAYLEPLWQELATSKIEIIAHHSSLINGYLNSIFYNWEQAQTLDHHKRLSPKLAWLGARVQQYRKAWYAQNEGIFK